MDINDDTLSMAKGWVVKYEDGKIITEYDRNGAQINWRMIPKVNIKSISLKWFTKNWTITGKEIYLQKKRGWVAGASGDLEPSVQYRYIGYWEGNDRVFYRVDELTGVMVMVVETLESVK